MMDTQTMERARRFPACLVLYTFITLLPLANTQQSCPSSMILTSTDLIGLSSCTDYQGDLVIGDRDCSQACNITSLSALSNLVNIAGSLSINCCPHLLTIEGLNVLRSVQSIDIYYNVNVTIIAGFRNLLITDSVRISQNPSLTSITGFSALASLRDYLEIDRNPSLTEMNFAALTTITGNDLLTGAALSISYNTALTQLSGFPRLNSITYGTVRIEGNRALCYAGYPQWGDREFVERSGLPGNDKGLDWRTFFPASGSNQWQYTWNVLGGGIPTLVIRDNAPAGSCGGAASCNPNCETNAGCLGPDNDNPNLCGRCTPINNDINPCTLTAPPPPDNTLGIVLGVVLTVVVIVLLVLAVFGVWGCVVVRRRYKDLRQGSFDISVNSVEDPSHQRSSVRASQQIATVAEPTTGSNVSRKGVKYTPKLDSVVVSSYKPTTYDDDFNMPDSYIDQRSTQDEIPAGRPRPMRSLPKSGNKTSDHKKTSRSSLVQTSPPINNTSKKSNLSEISPSKRSSRYSSPEGPDSKKSSRSSLLEGSATEPSTEDILARLREEQAEVPMNFPWDAIRLGKELGTGDFGKVFHAEARKLLPGQRKTAIMVKQLKEGASNEERETFMRPVEAMKVLQHPNVLSLLGVSMKGPSILVMLEYCSQGNFKTFLVRKRKEAAALKQNNQLINMAIDMAAGLDYLHSMNIAHNDFAARSCLVTSDGKIKLGDYGITRQTFKEDYYARRPNQKALPIRWMAPELIVIKNRNTLESLPVSMPGNIWSFGVSLWEVCSFAQWPYDDLSNEEVLQTLKTTRRCILENPLEPSDHIAPLFSICKSCWQPADLRPSMSQIHSQLQVLTNQPAGRRMTTPNRVSHDGAPTIRPKSQTFITPPHDEAAKDDTLKRSYKPRRAAPTKPAPSRPAPGHPNKYTATFPRSKGTSQEEPLIISNDASLDDNIPTVGMASGRSQANRVKEFTSKKKMGSKETLLSNSSEKRTAQSSGSRSKLLVHGDPFARKPTAGKITEPLKKSSIKRSKPLSMEPDRNRRELPHPKEMNQAVEDEHAMAKTDDDFILEPPQKFSQSSLDDLEEEGSHGAMGGYDPDIRPQMKGATPTNKKHEFSTIERKIYEKKLGNKILSRTKTPAALAIPSIDDNDYDVIDDDFDDVPIPQGDDYDDLMTPPGEDDCDDVIIPNPSRDEMYQFDESLNQYDDYDEPEALEDELPDVVYDEEVAALIW